MPKPRTEKERAEAVIRTRLAPITGVDAESLTTELVWSTGAPVRRYSWQNDEYYDEHLDMAGADLSRLNKGAPLLNTHSTWDLSDVIGVVESARVENGVGLATVRFSDRESVAPIWSDVRSGIIRNVSVGYQIRKVEITREDGKLPVYRAVDWLPMEISLVPVGADDGAQLRYRDESSCIYQEEKMPETVELNPAPAAAAAIDPVETKTESRAAPVISNQISVEAAVSAERKRVSEIQSLCRKHTMDDEFERKLIDEGTPVSEVGLAILGELARKQGPHTNSVNASIVRDEVDTFRAGVQNALMHRVDGRTPLDAGRNYRGMKLMEIAREIAARENYRSGDGGRLSDMEVAGYALGMEARGGMMTTSDLPNILANVANKSLRDGYAMAPATWKQLCNKRNATDFKQVSRTQLSGPPKLEKVNEHGEYKRGSVSDAKEVYSLATYGKVIAFTRQAMINDDLSALGRIPQLFGVAAANLESDTVWGIINANAAMGDGVALFHANHANLAASGAAPSVTTLGAARLAMRKQKGLENDAVLNLAPKYIIVPPEHETAVDQLITSITPAVTTNVVPDFVRSLTPVTEARLSATSATAWYLAADPMMIDTIEYAYLEGQEGVYIESRVGFDVDGLEIKGRLDFAAKAIDFRGLYKNAGV